MGDELPHRRKPQLTDDTDDQQRGTILERLLPCPRLTWVVTPQLNLSNSQPMEFAPYPTQVLGLGQYENLPSSLNMGNMTSALPDYQSRAYGRQPHQQQLSSSPSSNLLYQVQQSAQFAGQNVPIFNPTMQQQYAVPSQQSQHQGRPTAMPYTQFGSTQQFTQQLNQQLNQQSQYQPQTHQFYQQPVAGSFGHSYTMRGTPAFPMGQMRGDGNMSTSMSLSAHQSAPRSKISRSG